MKKIYFLIIPLIICSFILNSSFEFKNSAVTKSVFYPYSSSLPTIIIDAGHGGFDGGAVTKDGFPEKQINLNIALFTNEFLQLFGFNTVMTRTTDTSLEDKGLKTIRQKKVSDIHNRMKIMEKTDNSVYLSIHQNNYSNSKYSGMQVFYSGNFSEQSALLAQSIQDVTVELLQSQNTRQIKECGTSVYLIYNAVKPACLVECGFLSNYEESEKLKTDKYQKEVAYCIALGVQRYYITED